MTCARCKNDCQICHKCPDMGGEIMPGCYGAVTHGDEYCTCLFDVRDIDREIKRLQGSIDELKSQRRELMRHYKARESDIH